MADNLIEGKSVIRQSQAKADAVFQLMIEELIARMVNAALDGDLPRVKQAQQDVAPLAELIYKFGEPGCGAHQRMKVARWLLGRFPSPHFRRPIRPLPVEEVEQIRSKLLTIGYEEL